MTNGPTQRMRPPSSTKTAHDYTYHGFGFPVVLRKVTLVRIQGVWVPKIDVNRLTERTLLGLIEDTSHRLTGDQVRFIRLHFQLTYQGFARRFAVSHPAVMKWERTGDHPTGMSWATEKDIRLFVMDKLSSSAKEFKELYCRLMCPESQRSACISVDASELAA